MTAPRIRLGVGAPPAAGLSDRDRREISHADLEFRTAFKAGQFDAAASWAGQLAVRLEERDDPRALDWWRRNRWLRARAEAGWDGSCDVSECTARATVVLVGEWDNDDVVTVCAGHGGGK